MVEEWRTISLCMIVQDEEETIARCLDSVLEGGLVQEVCIVDGGSRDHTLDIIHDVIDRWHTKGVKFIVSSHPFDRNFGAQKSRAVSLATKEWVLWIDADEVYTKDVYQAIPRLQEMWRNEGQDAFSFPRHTRIDGWLHNIIDPDYQIRFWKNHIGVHYVGRIHESPTGFHRLVKTNVFIDHNKSFAQQQRDNELYWDMGQVPPPGWVKQNGKWIKEE